VKQSPERKKKQDHETVRKKRIICTASSGGGEPIEKKQTKRGTEQWEELLLRTADKSVSLVAHQRKEERLADCVLVARLFRKGENRKKGDQDQKKRFLAEEGMERGSLPPIKGGGDRR